MDKKLKDDIIFLVGLQKAKDKNEPTGYDVNLFKSSFANKIKSMAKRGTQSEVDEALKYLYEINDKAGASPVFTTSHSIWSFGTWQPVTIDYDGSTGERYAFYVNPDSKSVKVSNLKTGDESVYSNEEFVETNDLPASMVNMVSLKMLQKVRGWQIKSKAQPTAKSEEIKNENMSKSSSSSFSDKFFEENPEKILGTAEQKKDQWGKPMMYVKGGVENINQIDTPEIPDPTITSNIGDSVISETTQSIINDPQNEENIDIAIEAAEKKIGNDVIKRQRRSKKGVGVSDSLSEIEHGMLSFDEVMKQYNEGITDEEIGIWVEFNERRGNPLGGNWNKYKPSKVNREWFIAMMKKGLMAFNPETRDFEPEYIYYAGNVYDKISNILQNEKVFAEVGQAQYEKQLQKLTELKNEKQLSLVAGDPQRRLIISPISQFSKDFLITKLNDGSEFETPISLKDQYEKYLWNVLDTDLQLPVSKYDIIRIYLDLGSDRDRRKSKEEKFENKKNARIEGERLFQKFLYEEITLEDKNKIEQSWNSQFNNWIDFNYNKIPVAFECSDTFKRGKMSIRPAQREAVAFMAINKTGVVAYDVGVGKTASAILSIAYTMQSNQCKRPLIIVPNATYEKWKAEITGIYNKSGKLVGSGILPQYKINDYRNLGKGYFEKAVDEKTGIPYPIEEGSITVMTYEALTQIGFDIENNPAVMSEILSILEDSEETARKKAGLFKKAEGIAGKVSKETKVNFEDFGFDYICVDEAHNFKNIFSGVRGGKKGNDKFQRPYEISGTPSTRGLKLFIISQLMYNKTGGKNICLLTATPFTNNPLEVYSMLSLCGYKVLKERGIGNIIDFFDSFVKQTYELTFNSRMEFQMKAVIKSWSNAVALRNIIFSLINYKSGEDANIQRPNKIVLPLMRENVNGNYVDMPDEKQILTFLTPTPEQREYLADIQNYVTGGSELKDLCNPAAVPENCRANDKMSGVLMDAINIGSGKEDKGRTLRALHYARSVTLSPYLYACSVYCGVNPNDPDFYKEYVESSPKLKYVVGCIQSVKKWHEKHGEPCSGQIIYMDAGKEYFKYIIEYLIREIGFEPNEVKTITGDDSFAQREETKSLFLSGEVKVIIGTGAIKEGIDLQDNTSVVYNCYMDWRPTDVKQLEGRAWRFGNRFANVRIVTPLLENSLDPFLFQKLEEKTARINDIFDRNDKKNILDVEEFNPEELKMGLITDPIKRAKEQVSQESAVVEREIKIAETKISSISDVRRLSNQMLSWEKDIHSRVEWKFKVLMESYSPRTIFTTDKDGNALTKEINAKKDLEERGITSPDLDIEKAIEFGKYYDRITGNIDFVNLIGNYRDVRKKLINLEKSVLQPRGFSLADDLESVIQSMKSDVEELRAKVESINGDDYLNSLVAKYQKEIDENNKKRGSLEQRVAAFATLNDKCLSEMMDYGQMQQAVVAESKKEKDEADNKNRMRMLALKAKADADALALLELEMEMGM